ncbi:MAG TPA: glycosyltransferase family 4 protein [Methylotenera sp.]
MKKKLKLGLLVSHPIQYFVPIYREIAMSNEVDLTVLYLSRMGLDEYFDEGFGKTVKWDIQLVDGYKHQFLSKKNKVEGINWGIVSVLLRNRFDVILVHGYNNVTNLIAIIVARLIGTKVLMRGDTRVQPQHQHANLKAQLKRIIFKLCNGFVTIGTLNKNYFLQHGVPLDRLFFAPFCVSNEQFNVSAKRRVEFRQEIRVKLDLSSDSLIVLFVSKLISRKRADELIKAFATLEEEFPNACLVIAGSGEDEGKLRSLAESLGVLQIRFLGFQNQTKLPAIYAASDIFVLPADSEPWGLVVNEVMAAGVPVIVSSEVGAAADLVEGKGTGIVYQCGDVVALCRALGLLMRNSSQRQLMSSKALELIRHWDTHECVLGILNAVATVVQKK